VRQRRVTDGNFFIAQIMFLSHKKSLNVKISNKKFSFFSSRNQYFPHIPYVAGKKFISGILNYSAILDFSQTQQAPLDDIFKNLSKTVLGLIIRLMQLDL
jgi:hypothetical protein